MSAEGIMSVVYFRQPRVVSDQPQEHELVPITHAPSYSGRRVMDFIQRSLQDLPLVPFFLLAGSFVAHHFFVGLSYRDIDVYLPFVYGPHNRNYHSAQIMVMPQSMSTIAGLLRHVSTFDMNIMQVCCIATRDDVGGWRVNFFGSPAFISARISRFVRINLHRYYRETMVGRAQILIRLTHRLLVSGSVFEDCCATPCGPVAAPGVLRGVCRYKWACIREQLSVSDDLSGLFRAFDLVKDLLTSYSPKRRRRSAKNLF